MNFATFADALDISVAVVPFSFHPVVEIDIPVRLVDPIDE